MAGKIKFDQEAAFKSLIGATQEAEEPVTIKAEKGRPKLEKETKKRISLAVYPSSYENLQKIAYVDRQSASDIISKLIENYVAENLEKLKEYNKIKPE